MKILYAVYARLQEASTYAGMSAVCVAISTALSQSGPARYIALAAAIATGVGAIAKAEHNPSLANAMDEAIKLVPALTAAVIAVEARLRPRRSHPPERVDQPGFCRTSGEGCREGSNVVIGTPWKSDGPVWVSEDLVSSQIWPPSERHRWQNVKSSLR